MKQLPLHNNNFDFLRFLFASFVIGTHSYALLGNIKDDPLYHATGRVFSEIGVCGFFVLSGYLIFQSLERSSSLGSFFRKRVLRIFPGLIVAVLFSALIIGAIASTLTAKEYYSNGMTWRYILDNIILLPRQQTLPGVFTHHVETAVNGSLWTLRYELLFYGILGTLFFFSRPLKQKIVVAMLLLCLAGYFILKRELYTGLPEALQKFLFYCCNLGSYFLSGALLSFYTARLQRHKTALLLCSSLLFTGVLFVFPRQYPLVEILSFPVMIITAGLHYSRPLHFSRYTGDISYGTYIYAYPLQQLLILWLQPQQVTVLLLASFPVSWLAGYLSWHLVEKRFLRKH